MAQVLGYQLPKGFTFSKPEGWPSWIRRFKRFREASDLDEKSKQKQVSSLAFAMGDETENILNSFRLSDDERKPYTTVRGKFESYMYFVKKRNIVFDRLSFFQSRQEEGEPVASFVNDVYALAKHCNFGALHDEMIRDILAAGTRDEKLSQRLQLDGDLTPEKAVTCIRQSETIHQQQVFLRGDNTRQFPIDAVKTLTRLGKNTS